MKKIISMLLVLVMFASFCFAVEASEPSVSFELDLKKLPLGDLPGEYVQMHADNASMIISEDEETKERVIKLNDENTAQRIGINFPLVSNGATQTLSFDYYQHVGFDGFPCLYYGSAVYLMLADKPAYYTGKEYVAIKSVIKQGEWINFTVVFKASSNTIDFYIDSVLVVSDAPAREGAQIKDQKVLTLTSHESRKTRFDLKNIKVYDGEYIPPIPEKLKEVIAVPDRYLVDYADSYERLNNTLADAVAMTVGNSMARVNNQYVNIDPDNVYVAPFITPDGYTLVPTRFTAETIGAEVEVVSSTCFKFSKDGTVMEINMGDKNAIINGVAKEMPTTPVIKHDRLFIPLRFAAETFGKNVFWDDRGLIVISDNDVVKPGQEDIIKPLITEIRTRTSIFGNSKYSDVNYTARQYQNANQWTGLDASKRFMATINRWTYVNSGDNAKKLRDTGVAQQPTINACASGEYLKDGPKDARAYFLSGKEYERADGMKTWACINNPMYWENIKERINEGLDIGYFMWQFDDPEVNYSYRLGGCMCKYCVEGFKDYLNNDVTTAEIELLATQGITDIKDFDIVKWLASQGITTEEQYASLSNKPIDIVRKNFLKKCRNEFHRDIIAYMKEYSGSDAFYSVNANDSLSTFSTSVIDQTSLYDVITGVMGETTAGYTTADSIYSLMQILNSVKLENVISPLPKDNSAKQSMYSAIAMCYATGQQLLVAWDNYLSFGSRYFATVEEFDGIYEMAREYPFLLDNYEIPAAVGYVINLDNIWKTNETIFKNMLNKGIAAKSLVVQKGNEVPITFDEKSLGELQAIIGPENMQGLSDDEKAKISNSGKVYVPDTDIATVEWLENTYWTARDNNDKIYTVLRQNQLYDNAPTVVHAVAYSNGKNINNVEIEMNNLYLPEGDRLTINVYQPHTNYKKYTVTKGDGVTKFTIPQMNRWTILEICGPNTVRREVPFDLGEGVNGIGMGTRPSKDKAYGNSDDFTIVTYSEGINSATYGDDGTQDEASFVYKRVSDSKTRSPFVSANFVKSDGEFGVMVRDGIYSNARFAALMYDENNGLRIATRKLTDKAVLFTELGTEKPEYMKLIREGNEYVAYTSKDGVSYKEVGRIEIEFAEPVAGIFAASPNGSRAECKVSNLVISDGKYLSEEIESFEIKYKDGNLPLIKRDEVIEATIKTASYKNLGINDVDITFTSSDENVVVVDNDGSLTPKSLGSATITAIAKIGMKKATATTNIYVIETNPVMFEESFDTDVFPSYITKPASAIARVKDGVLQGITENSGVECDMKFTFEQENLPAVFEFDFKAHYGTDSPTTGARVIYANRNAISLTSENGSLHWFYGNQQTKIADISTDEWHHVKIEANYDEQWCNVYFDGVKVVDKGAPRSPMIPDGAVTVGAWRIGTDSCYEWDNFKFYYVAQIED